MTTPHDNRPRALLAGYIASVIVAVGAFSDLTDIRDRYGWPAIVALALGVAGAGLIVAPAGKLPPLVDPRRRVVGAGCILLAALFAAIALADPGQSVKPPVAESVKAPEIEITDCGTDWHGPGTTATKWNTGGTIYNPNRRSLRVSFQAALRFPQEVVHAVPIVRTVPALATARYDVGTPYSPDAPLPRHSLLSQPGGGCDTVDLRYTTD